MKFKLFLVLLFALSLAKTSSFVVKREVETNCLIIGDMKEAPEYLDEVQYIAI